jgi:Integrase zinc binding domain
MLSRPPTDDKGEKDNWDLTLLPPHLFIRTIHEQLDSWEELTRIIAKSQRDHLHSLELWKERHAIVKGPDGLQYNTDRIVIPPDDSLKWLILRRYHDAPTAGHPGRDRTEERVTRTFWWPQMTLWIADYIKGCAMCQQNKRLTHPNRTPLTE